MGLITTNAIVLHRADYRDHDRMLTLFSPTLGKVEAICRGCKRQKSPLMPAAEYFSSGEYVLWQGKESAQVRSCQVQDSFYPLREDYEKLTHGMYMLDLCRAAVQPEQENSRLFLLLLRCLAHMAYGDAPVKKTTVVFMMGMLSLLGFRPLVGRCARCGKTIGLGTSPWAGAFGPEEGGVLCMECGEGRVRLTGEEIGMMQDVMRRGVDVLEEKEECTETVFRVIRRMAEDRLGTRIPAGSALQQ